METLAKSEEIITARTLSGFRDLLPSAALMKEDMLGKLKGVFRQFGFAPIETPHLEHTEILLGKGSTEINKQLYRFRDNGNRDVTLRFDHTVPLARFVVQHRNELGTLFKRYAIGNVFRGESPQAGRYREFTQCDFDFIGTHSLTADAEVIQVMHAALKALNIHDFTIFLNNRKILNGLAEWLGVTAKTEVILTWIDKIGKIGIEQVRESLISNVGLTKPVADQVITFVTAREMDTPDNFLAMLSPYKEHNLMLKEGIEELEYLYHLLSKLPISKKHYSIDLSIARGLGYYTGIIYETVLDKLPQIGSVCSGGRFDNLTKSFSHDNLPGVGASIGLDRLLTALEKLGIIHAAGTPAQVLIANVDPAYLADSYAFAQKLRDAGIAVEVYPEVVKLGRQFSFASNRGHRHLVVFGETEHTHQTYTLANMASGNKTRADSFDALVQLLHSSH